MDDSPRSCRHAFADSFGRRRWSSGPCWLVSLHRTAGCVVFAGLVRLISHGGLVDTIRHNSPVRLGDMIRHESPVRLGVWPNTRGSLQASSRVVFICVRLRRTTYPLVSRTQYDCGLLVCRTTVAGTHLFSLRTRTSDSLSTDL